MNYIHSCSCDNSAPTESHQFVRSCTRNVAAITKLMEVVCKEDAPDGTHLRKGHAIQPTFSCLCFKFGQVILLHTMSSPQFLSQAHKYRLQAHLYQGSVLSKARLRINVDPCHSPPKRFNRFNACGRWLDILQVYSRHRAHLYSTRELYSTHVPRGEEEEAEEKDTAETSPSMLPQGPAA